MTTGIIQNLMDSSSSEDEYFTDESSGEYSSDDDSSAFDEDEVSFESIDFKIQTIQDLLRLLQMEQYQQRFIEEHVDLTTLLFIKDDHLKSLGLESEERYRLLRVVNLVKLQRQTALKQPARLKPQKKPTLSLRRANSDGLSVEKEEKPKNVRFSLELPR